MRLVNYRVRNFRSVDDSGLVEVDGVTALIGTNEAGKTNLLLPFWKLNPAKGGELNPTADFPRKYYNDFRKLENKPVFIEAVFALSDSLATRLASLTGFSQAMFSEVHVSKCLDGELTIRFPHVVPERTISSSILTERLATAGRDIENAGALPDEADFKTAVIDAIATATAHLATLATATTPDVDAIKTLLDVADADEEVGRSMIRPRFARLLDDVAQLAQSISMIHPDDNAEAGDMVANALPSFVYYSNYGNLDSEIYLPHVIENLTRAGLGAKEEAKARTLKVLFEFVGLEAAEILELGKEIKPSPVGAVPADGEIQAASERKKQRAFSCVSGDETHDGISQLVEARHVPVPV